MLRNICAAIPKWSGFHKLATGGLAMMMPPMANAQSVSERC